MEANGYDTKSMLFFWNLASKEYQMYGGRSTRIEGIVWYGRLKASNI